jgi:hypothetical protein
MPAASRAPRFFVPAALAVTVIACGPHPEPKISDAGDACRQVVTDAGAVDCACGNCHICPPDGCVGVEQPDGSSICGCDEVFA